MEVDTVDDWRRKNAGFGLSFSTSFFMGRTFNQAQKGPIIGFAAVLFLIVLFPLDRSKSGPFVLN
jgi:hypothetical protein